VDFIAAEDTRVTQRLLSHFGIKKPLVSYYAHNLRQRGQALVDRLLHGENAAIVTDAGMPCISDPGEDLVRLCGEQGVETIVVPGPSAVIAALSLSGLATGRFSFEGFLSVKRSSRFDHLEEIKNDRRTLVFYEAPHKLPATLRDMLEVLGDRRIVLARELTKLHEEVLRTTLSEAVARTAETPPRGEFVLVIEGAAEQEEDSGLTLSEAVARVRRLAGEGRSLSAAAKEVAGETGYRKGDLYKAALENEPKGTG
jgi:16S rRNA (cytidine1402-2'-O)-methyltransferase